MRKLIVLGWCIFIILMAGAAVSSGIFQIDTVKEKDYAGQMQLFTNALSVIESNYVEQIDPDKLIYGALSGMAGSLDQHSQFMDQEAYKEIKLETQGEFGGLGVEITIKDGLLTVVSAIEGTPAQKAGLLAGDRVVKIDGKSTKDFTLSEAARRLRGKPGTTITLAVLREEERRIIDFKITRAIIKLESVKEARIIDKKDKIGYIKIIEFQQNTPSDLNLALIRLKLQGMGALILDLRNNPGGLLDAAVEVAEEFIPNGNVIVYTKGRAKDQNIIFKSKGKNLYTDIPMVVLINKGSASASEIVAGSIQANKRGIVLGTKTFGKGSVQTVIPLRDGSALRLTTAKYYTPDDKSIDGQGITPDIIIQKEKLLPEQQKDIFEEIDNLKLNNGPAQKEAYDNQLQTAVNLLKGIRVYRNF